MEKTDLLQGTLDMLILKVLNRGPMHGFGIAERIQRLSEDYLSVGEGSLYPALYRLQQRGWVESEWGQSENNRRASYLRMPRKDDYVVIQVPNPLQPSASASGTPFENYFYSIDGPASTGSGLNMHKYLHTVVNDLVKVNYSAQGRKFRASYEAGKDATISRSYGEAVNWYAECLVHAIDHRIMVQRASDPAFKKRIEANVEALTRGGYTLLGPSYQALESFEQSGKPFDQYLPTLLQRLPNFSRKLAELHPGAVDAKESFTWTQLEDCPTPKYRGAGRPTRLRLHEFHVKT